MSVPDQGPAGAGVIAIGAAAAAAVMGGRLVRGAEDAPITSCSIDSRTIAPGALFVAIRGDRLDGHAYAAAAVASGAAGVVVSDPAAVPANAGIAIVVDDTVRALQALARHVRRASGARVVAITGSVGKTTTKEAAAEFLSRRYRVYRSAGNLNNHIGLPLSLLELRARPEVAVVELGMNHAGEIRTLVGIAEPDVRVWINVAEVHSAFFASLDAIADAKAEILDGAHAGTMLVANLDDPLVMSHAGRFAGRVITFGASPRADLALLATRDLALDGTDLRIRTAAGEVDLHVPLIGRGNVTNVLAATAVACSMGVGLEAMAEVARTLRPSPHRGEVVRLAGGVTLIDDSYNSNPRALEQALAVVASERRCARKLAVLGEMLELGAQSVPRHVHAGRLAADAGLCFLVTVGGEPAAAMARAARAAGMPDGAVSHVAAKEEAADRAVALLRAGDLVLVKGSRGIGTELVVDRIASEFA